MKLKFLGRGAGFNPDEGSTAAYFIDKGELFLIDAGESIFHTVQKRKLLNSVSVLNILITHTHADHVGSLGTVILYAFAIKKIPVNIIYDKNMAFLPSLRSLLKIYGLGESMYNLVETSSFSGKYSQFDAISYIKTTHCKELKTCGIVFETKQGLVFYSGDFNNVSPLAGILKSGRKIDKMYVDSCNDLKPNLHHVSIHQINGIVPPELKKKVYCMHLNNAKCAEDAAAYGFNVVSV
jgi:phosphoribosyl 1,2-cyclic phosphodiesterase